MSETFNILFPWLIQALGGAWIGTRPMHGRLVVADLDEKATLSLAQLVGEAFPTQAQGIYMLELSANYRSTLRMEVHGFRAALSGGGQNSLRLLTCDVSVQPIDAHRLIYTERATEDYRSYLMWKVIFLGHPAYRATGLYGCVAPHSQAPHEKISESIGTRRFVIKDFFCLACCYA